MIIRKLHNSRVHNIYLLQYIAPPPQQSILHRHGFDYYKLNLFGGVGGVRMDLIKHMLKGIGMIEWHDSSCFQQCFILEHVTDRQCTNQLMPKILIFCGVFYLLPLGLQLSTSSIFLECQTLKTNISTQATNLWFPKWKFTISDIKRVNQSFQMRVFFCFKSPTNDETQ